MLWALAAFPHLGDEAFAANGVADHAAGAAQVGEDVAKPWQQAKEDWRNRVLRTFAVYLSWVRGREEVEPEAGAVRPVERKGATGPTWAQRVRQSAHAFSVAACGRAASKKCFSFTGPLQGEEHDWLRTLCSETTGRARVLPTGRNGCLSREIFSVPKAGLYLLGF